MQTPVSDPEIFPGKGAIAVPTLLHLNALWFGVHGLTAETQIDGVPAIVPAVTEILLVVEVPVNPDGSVH